MAMLAASVFLQTDLSRGSTGTKRRFLPERLRLDAGCLLRIRRSGRNRTRKVSSKHPIFSNAAVHKDEPAITGSRSGGQI